MKRKSPMFTSRHYLLIAQAINKAFQHVDFDTDRNTMHIVVRELMDKFSADNLNFSPDIFMEACFKESND